MANPQKTPAVPKHLGRAGRDLFRRLREEYRIGDGGGLTLLTTAAECADRMEAARAAIEKDGAILADRYGASKLHPACQLEKDARGQFLQTVKLLGLDLEPAAAVAKGGRR